MLVANPFLRLTTMPASAGRVGALDGLRGIAVILTFLVHLSGSYLAAYRGGNPNVVPFSAWTSWFDRFLFWSFSSHHGVYLFFILSGFLIGQIIQRPGFLYSRFAQRRIARIYPPFLLAAVVTLLLNKYFWLIPEPRLTTIFGNLLFLNGAPGTTIPGILGNNVSWSLFYEMSFYLIFPLLIFAGRKLGLSIMSTLLIGSLLVSYAPGVLGLSLERFGFLFAGAVVGALHVADIRRVASHVNDLALIACYCFITSMHTLGYLNGSHFDLLFALVGALVLLKAASGEGLIARALSSPPLVWLGGISYSFYLLHSIGLGLAFGWTSGMKTGTWTHMITVAAIGFTAATVLAAISFALAERFYFRPSPGPGNVQQTAPA